MMSNKFGGTSNMVRVCSNQWPHTSTKPCLLVSSSAHIPTSRSRAKHCIRVILLRCRLILLGPWPTLMAILFAHTLFLSFVSIFCRLQVNRNKIVCKLTMHSCRTSNARITAALDAIIRIETVLFFRSCHFVFVCMWHWTISNIMQLKAPYIKTRAKIIPFSWHRRRAKEMKANSTVMRTNVI